MPRRRTATNRERNERYEVIRTDAHVQEQLRRLLGAFEVLHGTVDSPTIEELAQDVSVAIHVLELNPDIFETHGSRLIVQRGTFGYELAIRAGTINPMHMTPAGPAMRDFHPAGVGPVVLDPSRKVTTQKENPNG